MNKLLLSFSGLEGMSKSKTDQLHPGVNVVIKVQPSYSTEVIAILQPWQNTGQMLQLMWHMCHGTFDSLVSFTIGSQLYHIKARTNWV